MIRGRDIILISSIDWHFLWQGPQEITMRLSRAGNRVLYIENTGVRAPGLEDMMRIRVRLARWIKGLRSYGLRRFTENVHICSPLVMPPFGPGWRRLINRRLLLPMITRAAGKLGMRDPVLWTYLPTDTAVALIRRLRNPCSIVVYHCAADFSQLTPHAEQLKQSEQALLKECDVVFTICDELTKRCAGWNPNVHTYPYGIDLSAFPPEASDSGGGLADPAGKPWKLLTSLPRPIIGYVGGVHRYVDFQLLAAMAHARPMWSWVFVGPLDAEAKALPDLPNIYRLGQQPHPELVHYINSFDVCIVPYRKSEFTRTVVPVKINEYLAVGKPVVSTDIEPVLEFNRRHEVLITADNQPEAFLQAIEAALVAPADPAKIERRREVAALGEWQTRLEAMCALVEAKAKNPSFMIS